MPPRHDAGATVPIMATDTPLFHKEKHISYWLRCFRSPLPTQYMSMDSNRMALAFFTVAALDLLDIIFTRVTDDERKECINWIYKCQHPQGGFRGFPGTDFGDRKTSTNVVWDPATVPATYFALGALAILGDDFSRVNRNACLKWLASMQRDDGSFGETLGENGTIEGGSDARFGYCSMAVRWMLRGNRQGMVNGIPDVDVEGLVQCFRRAEAYDGGVSDSPFHEAHAGFTYCTLGACTFLERLPKDVENTAQDRTYGISSRTATIKWLLDRLTTAVEEPSDLSADDEDGEDDETSSSVPTANDPKAATTSSHKEGSLGFAASRGHAGITTPSFDPPDPSWVGFNGRANKIADTCYVWWAGGSLKMLNALELVDAAPIIRYLFEKTQHLIAGGFGKVPGAPPDIYHAYLGLAALATLDELQAREDAHRGGVTTSKTIEGAILEQSAGDNGGLLRSVDAALCFSNRAKARIELLPWREQGS